MRSSFFAIPLAAVLGCTNEQPKGPVVDIASTEPAAASECGNGTMPELGTADCAKVGLETCPSGFQRAASGWGCEAILPSKKCDPGRMARVGEANCIVVDNCSENFPPADATIFVGRTPRERLTSVRTISEALDLASAGDVIAVEQGVYEEDLSVYRDVRMVGRCAEDVVIRSERGIGVYDGSHVELRSLTLTGSKLAAIWVDETSEAVLDRMLLENNRAGAIASGRVIVRNSLFSAPKSPSQTGVNVDKQGNLVLENVEIRDAKTALFTTDLSKSSVKRSVLRYAGETDQSIVHVHLGAKVNIEESVLFSTASPLVTESTDLISFKATGERSTLEISKSQLEQRGPALDVGVIACHGSRLGVRDSRIVHGGERGIFVTDAGASTTITSSSFEALAQDHQQVSLVVMNSGSAEVSGSSFVGNVGGAVVALGAGSRVVMDRSLVRGSLVNPADPAAIGSAYALGADEGGTLEVSSTALTDNAHLGVLVGRGSQAVLRNMLIERTTETIGGDGDGVFVGGGTLLMEGSVVRKSDHAGLLFFGDGAGLISDSTLSENGVGLCTGGVEMVESTGVPEEAPSNITLVRVVLRDNGQAVETESH